MAEQFDVAILGAGPIGLEAALRAGEEGRRTVLLDRGGPAANVREWGHVRLFTPFEMNSSPRGRAAVADIPDGERHQTGQEFADEYLGPLAEAVERRGVDVRTGCVTDVHRLGWPKGRGLGDAAREAAPFAVEVDDERLMADVVLDCTGTFAGSSRQTWDFCRPQEYPVTPPAVDPAEVSWGPLDAAAIDPAWQHASVLVVGSGYTAATDVVILHAAGVPVVWLTRRDTPRPIDLIEDDPLPRRRELVTQANTLATSGKVDWRPGHTLASVQFAPPAARPPYVRRDVVAIGPEGEVRFEGRRAMAAVLLDTGFRPDTSLFRELHVHLCYATEGPMKLAAHLMGQSSADCLDQSGNDADLLRTPEPGFFVLGSKSYGRRSNFLLKAGIEQVDAVFDELIPPHPGSTADAVPPPLGEQGA